MLDGSGHAEERPLAGTETEGVHVPSDPASAAGTEDRCDLGDNQPLDPESELSLAIREAGLTLLQLQDCRTYDDYLRRAPQTFITRSPSGIHGVTQLAKVWAGSFLYLPPACGEEEINAELAALREVLAGIRPECARSGDMQSGSRQAGSINSGHLQAESLQEKVYSQGVYRQKEHKQKAAMQEILRSGNIRLEDERSRSGDPVRHLPVSRR